MKKLSVIKLIDVAVTSSTISALYFTGAGCWALLVVPISLWNFYYGLMFSRLD